MKSRTKSYEYGLCFLPEVVSQKTKGKLEKVYVKSVWDPFLETWCQFFKNQKYGWGKKSKFLSNNEKQLRKKKAWFGQCSS